MEIPIYFSLKKFEDNFDKDFNNYKKEFPDCVESDFKIEIKNLYLSAIENVTFIDLLELGITNPLFLTVAEFKGENLIDYVLNKIRIESTDKYDFKEATKLKYSFNRIVEFISNDKTESEEKIDNCYSVPQIIKIFDNLNFKGMMKDKGYTDFQTIQLLSDVFMRSEKSIRNNFTSVKHSNMAEKYIENLKGLKAKRN